MKPWEQDWAALTENESRKPWEVEWGEGVELKSRSALGVAGDVGRSLAGAAVSAVGAIPVAAGRLVREGGETLLGLSMDEAQRLAEAEGTPEKAMEWYERANKGNPASATGRGLEAVGRWVMEKGDAIRDSRSPQAREAARQSTPDGDLTRPSTWTLGEDPSAEGMVHVLSDVTGSMAPPVAAAIATRGRSAATQMRAGAVTVAGQVGGSAIEEAREYLDGMDNDTLVRVSPVFRDLLARGLDEADARKYLERKAENAAATMAAPVGAVGGRATAALLGNRGAEMASKVTTRTGKAILLGVLGASEEGLQEVAEGMATRAGINKGAGTDRSLTEGTFGEALLGAKGGGTVGAARGALAGRRTRRAPAEFDQVDAPPAVEPSAAPQTQPQAAEPEAAPALLRSPDQPPPTGTSESSLDQQQIGARLAELEIEAQMRQLKPWEEYERAELAERLDVEDQAQAPSMGTDQDTQASPAMMVEPDADPIAMAQPQVSENADTAAGSQALQNRDRSRAASVAQMADIARNPDYMRLATSRTPEAGAPMVFAVGDEMTFVPQSNAGRTDVAVMSDGQRVPFRYAVVEASNVQPSNLADGSSNPFFDGEVPGTLKALNNGRVAGLRAAYEQGNADRYRAELIADAQAHGVPVEVIQRTRNPILVRVYSEQSNTPDMAAKSQGQSLGMSPTELARQDAQHIDTSVLAVYQPAEVNSAANRDFVRAFVGRLNRAGQDVATLMTADGTLSQAGRQRLQAALMQAAYGDADLVAELFDSLDTDIKAIGEALKAVAGEWANMRDSVRQGLVNPQVDLTANLLQAVHMIRRARAERRSLHDMTMQPDLMTGEVPDPLTLGMLRMFYRGAYLITPRGREAMVAMLRDYVRAAMTTTAGADMFGDQVSPTQILEGFNEQGEPNAQTATQDRGTEPTGRPNPGVRPDQSGRGNLRHDDDAGSQAAGPAGRAAPAEQGAAEPSASVGTAERQALDSLRQEALRIARSGAFANRGMTFEDGPDGTRILFKGQQVGTLTGQRSRQNVIRAIQEFDAGAPAVTAMDIKGAAHEAATSPKNDLPQPTEAQKEAGNYKKGHVVINGLDISIENPAGSRRRPEWPPLKHHYGYFKGSIGADKDHVDVFLTDKAADESLPVFVVDQVHKNGRFDEHKVVMGAATEAQARAAYLANYEKGWTGLGAITQMSLQDFKAWVADPAMTRKPVGLDRGGPYNESAQQAQQNERADTDRATGGNRPTVGRPDRQVGGREAGAGRAPADGSSGGRGDAGSGPDPIRAAQGQAEQQAQRRGPQVAAEPRIEDVGEQLYANRRNFTGRGLKWDDVRDLNDTLKVKEVTKAKVWPRPDYEKLVADGMPQVVARLVKQVYDGISAGPTLASGKAPTDADLQRYIDTLSKVREGLFAFVNDGQRVANFAQGVLATIKRDASALGPVSVIDMSREAMDPQGVATVLLRQVWPEQFAEGMPTVGRFRRGSDAHQELAIIGGNKALGAMQFVRDDLRKWVTDLEKGWPAKREAWQVQGYRVLGPDEYRLDQYEGARGTLNYIRPVQGRGSWSRSEPFTGGKFALVLDGGSFAQEFDTRDAAIEAAREKVKRHAGAGQDVRGTNIEEAERTGPARRQEGEDITSQRLMDTFGFRGVNFGREGWIKQAERQAYLNQAFDGLMDLAEVLDVPPKAMSLDGKLGIAFGAQGKGRFAAHFVPGYNEINLTRTKGAGTLAHEWGHALDHHFALQAGLEKDAEPFLSEHASKGEKTDRMVFEGGRYVARKDVPTFGDGIRPEMVRAFREIYQAMTKRNESPGEASARRQLAQDGAGRRLTQWLRVARGRIEESAASNKADLLAEFDQHAEKLRQGDMGDGYERAGKQTFSTRVAAVRNLIKDATGRVWSLDETNGLEAAASYVRSLAGKQDADGAHEPQKVATQYKGDSRAMDTAKGGKAYWSTPTEMFARAFELYVHDALSQRGQRNTFLTDAEQRAAKPAQVPDTSSPTARASGAMRDLFLYPVGQERQALRQAFDALVGQIKTRETEQGVALFSRKDQPYTDRNGPDSTPTPRDRADIEGLEAIVDDGNRGAINAGSARRAREVHPFRWVRLPDLHGLGAIASAFGKRVVGFDVTAEVLSREFGFFNGVTRPGRDNRIFINARSDRPHLAVLGHEMAHQLKRDRPDLFQDLVQAIRPYVKAREYGEGFARSAVARYSYPQGASAQQRDAAVREEFIGEVLSDGFMDPGFWRAVGDHNPSLLQRLAAMVQRMIESIREATGYTARTSQYLSDYERVMAIAGRVMADYGLSVPGLDGQTGGPAFNRQGEAVDSPAFRSWFGDSKVVDEQGRPRVVYHGTRRDFSAFKPARVAGVASGTEASAELGHFFSDDLVYVDGLLEEGPDTFAEGSNVMPSFLALRNPKIEPMQKIQDIEESWTPERVKRYRKNLERLGHDGIIFRGRNASEYVAFRPEQIKSAVGNRGTFDPLSQDVRFNRNEGGEGDQANVTSMLTTGWARAKARVQELTSPAAIDRLLYEFQDKLIDLRRLRAHIQDLGGTITDLNDAYLGEELYHKRLAKRTADFLDKELKPLLADMRARAVKLPELERYLHARHAPEANRVLAERNPNQSMLDTYRQEAAKTVRDLERQLQRAKTQGSATTAIEEALAIAREESAMWIGAQAFTGSESKRLALSGMSDDEAKAHIAGLTPDKRKHLEQLAAMVDQMQAKTLGELESYGLMDRATLNAWRSTYKHYVPLHRDEAKADSDRHPIGQGYSVKGSGTRSRVGSNEKVTNILAHIAMQREATLTRGEKNLVVKKLYLMAAQNPDEELWSLDAPPKIKTVDPRNGTVRTTIDPTYKHRPNVLMVRIAGRDRSIVFNEHNPSAVRLAESMKNLDIGDLHVVLGLTAKGTRWFASVNTQYNPIFGLVNFARDVQAAMLQLSTTPLAGQQKAVASNVFTAMRAIYRQRRGKASRNNQWTALWDEFENVGGTTGYRDLFADADDRAKALAKELGALDRGQVSKAAHAVVDWLSHYNEVMENAVRLAAYKVALDQGMSKERSASLAKNLTVNFNRKGRQTRELGALYAFFNAALQGTARMVETLKGPIGRRIMFGGVALGAINTLIGMAMMGGDDEDEPDNWEKIPDFIKQRSLIIPLGREDYLSIPMPLGYHVFPNIGRAAVEFAMGESHKSPGRQVGDLMMILVDAFNPVGGSENLGQMVAPTVIDPVVALMQNRDWTGRQIYRADMSSLDPTPGHTRAKDSASTVSHALSESINAITGGNEYRPGAWSPTPDQIDYVFGQLTGGLGRELIKVNQTASSAVTGDELPPYKVPLLGRVYGNTRGTSGQSDRYYENIRLLNELGNEIKGRQAAEEDVDEFKRVEPLTELVLLGNRTQEHIQKLRTKRRRIALKAEDGFREEVREVDLEIAEAMARVNNEVSRVRREARQ